MPRPGRGTPARPSPPSAGPGAERGVAGAGVEFGRSAMSFAIIRGGNGRRHEVDFGDDPVRLDVSIGEATVQITGGDGRSRPVRSAPLRDAGGAAGGADRGPRCRPREPSGRYDSAATAPGAHRSARRRVSLRSCRRAARSDPDGLPVDPRTRPREVDATSAEAGAATDRERGSGGVPDGCVPITAVKPSPPRPSPEAYDEAPVLGLEPGREGVEDAASR